MTCGRDPAGLRRISHIDLSNATLNNKESPFITQTYLIILNVYVIVDSELGFSVG